MTLQPVESRDYGNYRWGDDVYALGDHVARDLAELYDIKLGIRPGPEGMNQVLYAMGIDELASPGGVLRGSHKQKLELVDRAGSQRPLDRALRNPNAGAAIYADNYVLVANQASAQDRAARLLVQRSVTNPEELRKPVFVLAGERTMNTVAEDKHPNIWGLRSKLTVLPTEEDYATEYTIPKLEKAGYKVTSQVVDSTSDASVAVFYLSMSPPKLQQESFAYVGTPDAIQTALEHRKIVRGHWARFDQPNHKNQLYAVTDALPLAKTAEDELDSQEYQSVDGAVRHLAQLVVLLAEATADKPKT